MTMRMTNVLITATAVIACVVGYGFMHWGLFVVGAVVFFLIGVMAMMHPDQPNHSNDEDHDDQEGLQ